MHCEIYNPLSLMEAALKAKNIVWKNVKNANIKNHRVINLIYTDH